jgi:hypothetical protein
MRRLEGLVSPCAVPVNLCRWHKLTLRAFGYTSLGSMKSRGHFEWSPVTLGALQVCRQLGLDSRVDSCHQWVSTHKALCHSMLVHAHVGSAASILHIARK